jgi:cytoskeletal protein RodZ
MASSSALSGIGKRLKAAREVTGRSLDDLAVATRINKAFLEEIENGREPKVPEIYLRAFIKTFATEVGEDPVALLEMLVEPAPPAPSASGGEDLAEPVPAAAEQLATPRATPAPPGERGRTGPEAVRRQAKILVGLATLVVAGLLLSVYWLRNERNDKGVQEISFSEVLKEQTAKLQPADSTADTARASRAAVPMGPVREPVRKDSLHLQAATTESVWVHIVLDGSVQTEYTLPPGYKLEWKAAKEFSISLGNPGGITFTLNGKKLGKLGEGKKPVKNVVLSHASLDGH